MVERASGENTVERRLSGGPIRRRRLRARTPTKTIVDYIWSDATGAGALLNEARKVEITENSSIVPASIRSVGVIPLGNSRRLERKVLAPAVVRDLLIRWLGLPSKARQAATPLAKRMYRRTGLSADSLLQETTRRLQDSPFQERVRARLHGV